MLTVGIFIALHRRMADQALDAQFGRRRHRRGIGPLTASALALAAAAGGVLGKDALDRAGIDPLQVVGDRLSGKAGGRPNEQTATATGWRYGSTERAAGGYYSVRLENGREVDFSVEENSNMTYREAEAAIESMYGSRPARQR